MSASASALPFIVILAARSVGSPSTDKSTSDAQGLAAVERVVASLNPPGPVSRVPFGVFAGSRLYAAPSAAELENPVIVGTFVLRYSLAQTSREQTSRPQPKGTADGVVGVISLLVEGKSCYLRGADVRWEVPGLWQEQLPAREGMLALPSAPLRVSRSPVRFVVRALGVGSDGAASRQVFEQAVDRARIVHEAAAAQRADGLGFPVRSEVMAAACAHFYGDRGNAAKATRSLRVHREVSLGYVEKEQTVPQSGEPIAAAVGETQVANRPQLPIFPARAPRCGVQTSPFGSPLKTEPASKESDSQIGAAWSVQGCLDFAAAQVERFTDELQKSSFAIISRTGRWVTLAAGRTSGLAVGSRLVSANGAKLHVIRIVPPADSGIDDPRQGDQAIAYVRSEDPKTPLEKGNQVTLDPQLYSDPVPPRK